MLSDFAWRTNSLDGAELADWIDEIFDAEFNCIFEVHNSTLGSFCYTALFEGWHNRSDSKCATPNTTVPERRTSGRSRGNCGTDRNGRACLPAGE